MARPPEGSGAYLAALASVRWLGWWPRKGLGQGLGQRVNSASGGKQAPRKMTGVTFHQSRNSAPILIEKTKLDAVLDWK